MQIRITFIDDSDTGYAELSGLEGRVFNVEPGMTFCIDIETSGIHIPIGSLKVYRNGKPLSLEKPKINSDAMQAKRKINLDD